MALVFGKTGFSVFLSFAIFLLLFDKRLATASNDANDDDNNINNNINNNKNNNINNNNNNNNNENDIIFSLDDSKSKKNKIDFHNKVEIERVKTKGSVRRLTKRRSVIVPDDEIPYSDTHTSSSSSSSTTTSLSTTISSSSSSSSHSSTKPPSQSADENENKIEETQTKEEMFGLTNKQKSTTRDPIRAIDEAGSDADAVDTADAAAVAAAGVAAALASPAVVSAAAILPTSKGLPAVLALTKPPSFFETSSNAEENEQKKDEKEETLSRLKPVGSSVGPSAVGFGSRWNQSERMETFQCVANTHCNCICRNSLHSR